MENKFENVSKERKAPYWNHFEKKGEMAVCLHCKVQLKIGGGSTNGLNRYLMQRTISSKLHVKNDNPIITVVLFIISC